jgi:hypothetical protein
MDGAVPEHKIVKQTALSDLFRKFSPLSRRFLFHLARFQLSPINHVHSTAIHSATARRGDGAVMSLSTIDRYELQQMRVKLANLRFELALIRLALKAGFNPGQPRVPAGQRDGGQWTSGGGNNARIISDAAPDNNWIPGAQYAQSTPRGGRGLVRINGRWVQPTPGQAARLTVAEARAQDAIRRVQEIDPSWKPTPSAYESVEGLIRAHEADAQQAQSRLSELTRVGIGPGPFAGESIPARGSERDFTAAERSEINRIGSETGCHTCGTFNPGTPLGNFVTDHQFPSALNSMSREQRLYPQCLSCSLRQGGHTLYLRYLNKTRR